MKSSDGRVLRFVVAGAVNTGLSWLAYLALLRVTGYRVAFTISFVLGILLSYALNARFVFRRPVEWGSFLRFPLVYLVQYLAGLLLVSLLVEWLRIEAWIAPLLVLVVTIPLTYVLTRAVFAARTGR